MMTENVLTFFSQISPMPRLTYTAEQLEKLKARTQKHVRVSLNFAVGISFIFSG